MLLPLYRRGTSLRYTLNRRLYGPRDGLDGIEKRKKIPLLGIEPRLTDPLLYRLSYLE
jgi:hypothetical protein